MKTIMQLTLGLALLMGAQAANSAEATPVALKIEAQSLEGGLNEFAKQTGLQVIFRSEEAVGFRAPQLEGAFAPEEALRKLLGDSGLTFQFVNERTVAVRGKGVAEGRIGGSGVYGNDGSGGVRLAQAEGSSAAGQGAEENSNVEESRQGSGNEKIEEIVVTATKRVERVQDIPLSIAVISGQDLERRGLVGMEDYLRTIPGVNLVDRGSNDNAIVIRGVSVSQETEYFSAGGSTVATFFDETSITGAAGGIGVDVRPVDLERIEVLRGPQGTSFGNSSLGGALRYISAKPKLDGFSAKVSASYAKTGGSGDDDSMIQGVINMPIGDTFALRAVGYRYDDSGVYENIVDAATVTRAQTFGLGSLVTGFRQDDIGAMVSTGGRLTALWKPMDKLDLTLTYLQQTIEQNGLPLSNTSTYQQSMMPIDARAQLNGEPGEGSETELNLASTVLNYDLSWAGWTTVVSWLDGKASSAQDLSRAIGRPGSDISPKQTESISVETRLASHLDGRVQYLGGLFYEKADWDYLELAYWPGTSIGVPVPAGFTIAGTDPFFISDRARELDQRAVFGEVSYDLTQTLTATVGGRYFEYDRDERIVRREGSLLNIPLGGTVPQLYEIKEDGTNFKGNLTYKPTQNAMMYASWSEGFRLGRPDVGLVTCDRNNDGIVDNTTIPVSNTQNIASDTLESMEVGAKFVLFNRRMTVDAAVYHIKWDGLPVRSVLPTSTGCLTAFVANASAATSDGLEVQASLSVTDNLRLDFGGSYTNAELSADAPNLTPAAFEGYRLPGSPKVSGNLSAQYEFNVAGYKAFVRGDSAYTGEYFGDLLQSPGLRAGDYIRVDARAGVAINSLNLELYVRNLTNQDDFTWRGAGTANSGLGNPFFGYRLRPRTVGIQLGYSFE